MAEPSLVERLKVELYRSRYNRSEHKKLRAVLGDAIDRFEELEERDILARIRGPDAERVEELEANNAWLQGCNDGLFERNRRLEVENARLREKLQAYRDADARRMAIEAHMAMNRASADRRRRAERMVERLERHHEWPYTLQVADLIRELAGLEENDVGPARA